VSLATTLVTLGGLGFVFAFALVAISRGIILNGGLFLLACFFLLVVLAVAGLLVRQLSRLLNLYQNPELQSNQSAQASKKEMAGRQAPQIEAMSEPPISITENTTRTFEPVPADRQTKQNVS
jgi:membrane protein implicated in regulation of membrane protease activity